MTMNQYNIGFALCGSFCTFSKVIPMIEELQEKGYSLYPIMSDAAYFTDTRFGTAQSFREKIETICKRNIIHTIYDAEPIGPKKMLDALVIAPCTGNTLAKLAGGIADTSVTLAAKAHLRNNRPIVVAVSTNDALAGAASNIGRLLATKNYYFVPMGQDDPQNKPTSVVAHFSKIPETLYAALSGNQIQPILSL
jgi:dipicolinate synthase subunit B